MWFVEFKWKDKWDEVYTRSIVDININDMDALRTDANKVSVFMDWTLVAINFIKEEN